MDNSMYQSLWSQFGASITMLENAIIKCPFALWDNDRKFWYNAYHCLFFLDYYLTLDPIHFIPPPPFTLSEFGEDMPERVYSKEEIITYLHLCKDKCKIVIGSLTEENIENRWVNESHTMDYSVFEILLYNMRHVQHHAAQLNLILRQEINDAPRWVRNVI